MESDDPRLGDFIVVKGAGTKAEVGKANVALIGFPHDEGCDRNGGRIGAAAGPKVFRNHLRRTGCVPNPERPEVDFNKVRVVDFGDAGVGLDYDGAHDDLRRMVSEAVKAGFVPFIIGGSNDQSYYSARGFMDAENGDNGKSFGVINLDAHLDIRPPKEGLEHSGSPFRMLLEDKDFNSHPENFFMEFAAQGHQCAMKHVQWLRDQPVGSKIIWQDEADHKRFKSELKHMRSDNIFVSFDVDGIASAFCPGVSCPSPLGLTGQDAVEICFAAGRDRRVRLFDISEFNPDAESYLTGKLLSAMFYYFVMGMASVA